MISELHLGFFFPCLEEYWWFHIVKSKKECDQLLFCLLFLNNQPSLNNPYAKEMFQGGKFCSPTVTIQTLACTSRLFKPLPIMEFKRCFHSFRYLLQQYPHFFLSLFSLSIFSIFVNTAHEWLINSRNLLLMGLLAEV